MYIKRENEGSPPELSAEAIVPAGDSAVPRHWRQLRFAPAVRVKVDQGGSQHYNELSTRPSSSAFSGVVRQRRPSGAAMETVKSSWLWLSRNVDSFIVLCIDIYIENFHFGFGSNWSWFLKKAKEFDKNLVKLYELQNFALGIKFYYLFIIIRHIIIIIIIIIIITQIFYVHRMSL